ncbi:MAG: type I DNA topoisomerase, partial [Proteobacteria bacterium]
ITDSAVKAAIAKPRALDLPLIHAQRARQCLDKLVGYEVSPLLWKSSGGKSAGRVQSATLHLICERERERLRFKPQDYWTLHSLYNEGFVALYEPLKPQSGGANATAPMPTTMPMAPPDMDGIESAASRVSTLEEAKRIESLAKQHPHIITEVLDREEKRLPPAPFITSSLQQMANVRLRLSPQQTMKIAQELYEGVGGSGLITYMRTDAVTLSPEFINDARSWLSEHAPQALADKAPTFRTSAQAQGAHEAIRPTDVSKTPSSLRGTLSPEQFDLYEMIWTRAMASQCKAAILSKGRIVIEAGPTRWVARRSSVVDPGYLAFWKNTEDDLILPDVKKGQVLKLKSVKVEKKSTQPPPRYSEAKLIQLMEKLGIGRPSTYASTVATLKERDYAFIDKNAIAPTALGLLTDDVLMKAMPDIVDVDFTAKMETSLDRIAEGKIEWQGFLCGWNADYLQSALMKARAHLASNPVTPLVQPTWGKKKAARSSGGKKWSKRKSAAKPSASAKTKSPRKPRTEKLPPDIPF